MKHIMLISNSLMSLYNFRHEFVLRLLDEYKVTLVVPMEPEDYARFEVFKVKGCELIETNYKRREKNPLHEFALYKLYGKIIGETKPDVVITYTIKPNIYAGMICSKYMVPYMVNITGLGTAFEKEGLLKKAVVLMYKKALKKCDTIYFQNEVNLKIMQDCKLPLNNVKMVPGSGINLEKFSVTEYPPENTESYLYVARIMKAKGADEFLEAAERLKKKYPEVSFDVVGFCEEAYEERLARLQQDGVLTYHGWQDNAVQFFRKCSCLINPSHHEGMSNVCLEAAATGRPMIVSDIPGCKEIVTDKETGFLFPAGNTDNLFEKMEEFHLLPYEQKIQMGLAGRKKIEVEFDRNKVIDIYLHEIQRVLNC